MSLTIWWAIVAAVVVGHFGLFLSIYNRLNGFGLQRSTIKRIERFLFALMIALPPTVILVHFDVISDVLKGRPQEIPFPRWLAGYSGLCLATWFMFGIPWLMWRPIFGLEWVRAPRGIEVVDVEAVTGTPLALTPKCKFESQLPLNQIFDLAIEEIELPVVGLPQDLDGYRIAQLSDVHLTGHVHPAFTRYAVERATAWQPDLMALTGDIIDKQSCIDWLGEIFARPNREMDAITCWAITTPGSSIRGKLARPWTAPVGPIWEAVDWLETCRACNRC